MTLRASLAVLAVLLIAGCRPGGGETAEGEPPHPGEDIYFKTCISCHAAGVSGAPRTGDAEAWAPVAAKGMEALLQSTKEGIPPAMPAMGLCLDCTDQQLMDVIDYMIQESQPE